MKFSVDKQERYTYFKIEEENLNSVLAPKLKAEFVLLINEGAPNLILDLEDVKFIDSSGLSSILTANRLWTVAKESFILIGVQHPAVKKLIQISRLDSILKIIPTLSEARDYVFMDLLEKEINAPSEDEE